MNILFRNANVVDVSGKSTITGIDVLVENNTIKTIGHNLAVSDTDKVIDMTNKWLMPGLINMHEHQAYKRLIGTLYGPDGACTGMTGVDMGIRAVRTAVFSLKSGITTIFEAGTRNDICFSMRNAINRGVIPGPRMVVSGLLLTTVGGHANELAKEVANVNEMEEEMLKDIEKGSDWIKLLTSHEPVDGYEQNIRPDMSVEMISAAVKLAHAHGKKVSVHTMGSVELDRVIEAGVDAIHHAAYLTREQAAKMQKKNIAMISTISAYRNTSDPGFKRGDAWAEENLVLRPGFKIAMENALKEGVTVAAGTDSLGDLIDEITFMNEFGMDKMECLRSITITSAKIIGLDDSIGSVNEGKLADLVVFKNNPLEDFENLRTPELVMKDGCIYHIANLSWENLDQRWLLEYNPRS